VTASIPLWVPLVVAVLGLIGTAGGAIAGVIITQRRSDARENASWQRERERERERWAREEAARTFDLRREAYTEFYTAVSAQRRDFGTVHVLRGRKLKSGDFRGPTFDIELEATVAREKVRIYGSSVVVAAVEKITKLQYETLNMLGDPETTTKNLAELKLQEAELLRVIRADLGIPIGNIENAQG
jgi:hypothetical protein